MKYELMAYATTLGGKYTVKLFSNDEASEDLYVRYFHVTLEDKYHAYDFDAHFNTYDLAKDLFKSTIEKYGIKTVYISNGYLAWLTADSDWEEAEPTQEEEYAEACMASAYGDESLMNRYNRKYGIEKEYSPSNPWDAPGMSVRDFI